jgi:predicted transcriptional regulator
MALERDKQAKFQAVAEGIFQILIRGGIENLSHTRVAEVSGVSRAWLYKYIGKTSGELIAYSLDAIGKEFARTDSLLSQNTADDVRTRLFEGTFRMMRDAKKNPALTALYYRYSGTQNPVGMKIAEIEDEYLRAVRAQLERHFGLPKREAATISECLHAMRMGLAHRYSNTDLHAEADDEAMQKAMRRVIKHFAIEDGKSVGKK